MPRPPKLTAPKAPKLTAPAPLKSESPEAQEIRRTLEGFTGTEQWHSLAPISKLTFTDGVKYLADAGKASWLVTDVAAVVGYEPKVAKEEFVVAEIKVFSDNSATVTYTDGNNHKLYEQKYGYTDFPLNNAKIWITNGVMELPSEN